MMLIDQIKSKKIKDRKTTANTKQHSWQTQIADEKQILQRVGRR